MRAEFEWRRDLIDQYDETSMYQIRWCAAGRLPLEYDNNGPFGFLSTMSTPQGDTKQYGDRALWRGFISYFRSLEGALYSLAQEQQKTFASIAEGKCGCCRKCIKERGEVAVHMVLCPTCGNKRCPKATDHKLDCTNSNESGQAGSDYA